MRVIAFTSFTFSYLTRALILVRTLRLAHPDWTICALIVDYELPQFDGASLVGEFDRVVYASKLGIDRFRSWIFKHDIVEACTAVKGRMLCNFLDETVDWVVYLDPDIAVFHGLSETLQAMDTASILLTPHQIEANSLLPAAQDNEMTSFQFGIYNLGFLAVRKDRAGREFATWWAEQLQRACYDEPEHGLFTDQRYCDIVPALFEGVQIVRDPGCNVASWNISRRKISFSPGGDILVNGSLLKFYHFTKIFGVGNIMTEKYSHGNSAIIEIVAWYRELVIDLNGIAGMVLPWQFGRFSNGVDIPKRARTLYRSRPDLMAYFDDPFAVEGNSFYHWIGRETPDILRG